MSIYPDEPNSGNDLRTARCDPAGAFSSRLQRKAGKNFFASGACGPWMVTADEIADPFTMKLSTRLNCEEVQSTTVDQMIFDIPTLLSYVSTFLHLKPGDIVSAGSPEGSGGSRVPQRFLKPGEELEIEWSGVGILKNRVITPG